MAIDAAGMMNRVVALQKEAMLALATPVTVDAVPRFHFASEKFPYFISRLADIAVDADSEELDIYRYDVVMRLVIGHITQGYVGENDANLQSYIPHLIEYFNERELLQSAAYPAAMDDLTRARVVSCRGYTEFQNSGVGSIQVGTEITLRVELEEDIEQVYW